MPNIDTPHTGWSIHQAIPVAIGNVNTIAFSQQRALVGAQFDEVVPGVNKDVVLLLQFCRGSHIFLRQM